MIAFFFAMHDQALSLERKKIFKNFSSDFFFGMENCFLYISKNIQPWNTAELLC